MLDGKSNPRYNPMEVACWLDDYTATIDHDVVQLSADSRNASSPIFRRSLLDVQILSGLGHFYAAKIRSASYYRVYQRTRKAAIKQQAVAAYRKALQSWTAVAALAKNKYMDDITCGQIPNMRGCWADRTAAIAADIDAMEKVSLSTPGLPVNDAATQTVPHQIGSATPRPPSRATTDPNTTSIPALQ